MSEALIIDACRTPIGRLAGARFLTTLVHEMRRRRVRYVLATMCIGVGQGISMIVERIPEENE